MPPVPAADVSRFVYVMDRDFNISESNSIDIYAVNNGTAQLRFRNYIPRNQGLDMFSPAIDPLGRFFYDLAGYNNIESWWIDPRNSELHLISSLPDFFLAGNIAVHPSGQFLYANDTYADNGELEAFQVGPTGELTLLAGYAPGGPSGPVVVDPAGKFLYINSSEDGNVEFIYAIDQSTGLLTPVQGSPFSNVSMISSFDPSGQFAFAYPLDVNQNDINVYRVDPATGLLTLVTGSPFSSDSTGGFTDPAGRYFYQGTAGLVDVFSIDPSTGALTPIKGSPFSVQGDDALQAIDPSGHFAYFDSATYNRIDTYTVNGSSGALGRLLSSTPGMGGPGPLAILTGGKPVRYRPVSVFVADERSNSISAYDQDPANGRLTGPLSYPAGPQPSAVGGDPTGHLLYAVNSGADTITGFTVSYDFLSPVPGSPFATGHSPSSVLVLPSQKFLYVSNTADNTISVFAINPALGELSLISTTAVSGSAPGPLTTDATGSVLFVGNETSQSVSAYYVSAIDGSLREITEQGSPIGLGFGPGSFTVDPVAPYVYVTDQANNAVHAFLLSFYQYGGGPPILQPISGESSFPTGRSPVSAAIDPEGRYLYVANRGSNNISRFIVDRNTGSLTPSATPPTSVGSKPSAVSIDVSGKFLMATCAGSSAVYVFKIESKGSITPVYGSPYFAGESPSAMVSGGTVH
jgi:6-phosphogluconolactonase